MHQQEDASLTAVSTSKPDVTVCMCNPCGEHTLSWLLPCVLEVTHTDTHTHEALPFKDRYWITYGDHLSCHLAGCVGSLLEPQHLWIEEGGSGRSWRLAVTTGILSLPLPQPKQTKQKFIFHRNWDGVQRNESTYRALLGGRECLCGLCSFWRLVHLKNIK